MKTPSPSKYSTIHPPVLFDNPNCQPLHPPNPAERDHAFPYALRIAGNLALTQYTTHTRIITPPHRKKRPPTNSQRQHITHRL